MAASASVAPWAFCADHAAPLPPAPLQECYASNVALRSFTSKVWALSNQVPRDVAAPSEDFLKRNCASFAILLPGCICVSFEQVKK